MFAYIVMLSSRLYVLIEEFVQMAVTFGALVSVSPVTSISFFSIAGLLFSDVTLAVMFVVPTDFPVRLYWIVSPLFSVAPVKNI